MVTKLNLKKKPIKSAAIDAIAAEQAPASVAEATTTTNVVEITDEPIVATVAEVSSSSSELLKIRVDAGVRERDQTIIADNLGGKERWFDKSRLVSYKVSGSSVSMVMERRYLRTRGLEGMGTPYTAEDAEQDTQAEAAASS